MKHILRFLFVAVLAFGAAQAFGQGATTSAMSGRVTDDKGAPVPGATVIALHEPTGSQYGSVTNPDGLFRIANMQVGGPYKVSVSFVGFQTVDKPNIYLSLGQTYKLDVSLKEESTQLTEVEVVAVKDQVFDGNRTGAQTVVGVDKINSLPTLARDLSDFTRMTPQARVTPNGGITIAGTNNRYNSIMIDGAVNNDVFGLSETGTNGGQAGISPISIDAIEQLQVVIAPFDVRQGGFAGGGVNAVTRSGKNKFEGSAYWVTRNQKMAGEDPVTQAKLPAFSANTYGFRAGGAIVKNKLFFFLSAEQQRDQTPQPFDFDDEDNGYQGTSTKEAVQALSDSLLSRYGYNAGGFESKTRETKSDKYFLRLDWNISKNHKLTLRHSYNKGENVGTSSSSAFTINFANNGILFKSLTNSSALELKSVVGNSASNSLIIGYTAVNDDRDPIGNPFPFVTIRDGGANASIRFGTEAFSSANILKQNILTITDNFEVYAGKHTFTFGTHNEFYKMYNLFIRQNYGDYVFGSVADFLNGNRSVDYNRSYSLDSPKSAGDDSPGAADFRAAQLGFYVQDEYQALNNLKVTAGIRMDIPLFNDNPAEDTLFNSTTIPLLENAGWDLDGVRAGQMFKGKPMLAPRIGFNWDVNGDRSTQVRGGVGVFNSRIPLVWPGGAYTNNGLTIGGVRAPSNNRPAFNPDVNNQFVNADFGLTDRKPSGQMDLFVKDFKLPRVLRANLGIDQKLPGGIIGSVDLLYTKTLNNVIYYNLNVTPNPVGRLEGADNRPYYSRTSLDSKYTYIILADNTNKGYTYNATVSLAKEFEFGLSASVAYTYGRAMSVNDGTSSQNSSQWRFNENVRGKNNLDLTYSDFDLGSRFVSSLSYRKEYLQGCMASALSLFINAQSGERFSYIYGGYTDPSNNRFAYQMLSQDDNNSSDTQAEMIFVPATRSQINLLPYKASIDGAIVEISADQQWALLDEFIKNDEYLSSCRGQYAERNGDRLKAQFVMDLRFVQDFTIITNGETKHKLQFTLDMFNFTNLLNKDWGRRYFMSNDNFALLSAVPVTGGTASTPGFHFTQGNGNKEAADRNGDGKFNKQDFMLIDNVGVNSSLWQMQLGVRYSF